MAFYKASVKTNLIDPTLDKSNRRCEFRFGEDQVILSNMRIANLGITANPGSTYNMGAGAYEVIKSIHLYDGSTLLDQQLEFSKYVAWKNYNKQNSSNKDLNGFLSGNGLGYEIQGEGTDVAAPKINSSFVSRAYTTTETTTFKSWLDLKSCLPMLQSVLYLPTSVFKNLRLVIEFNKAVGTAQNTTAPLLIADEMVDSSVKNNLLSAFKGVEFVCVEHDSIVVDRVFKAGDAADKQQKTSKLLKGFDNKLLNRFVVVKESSGTNKSTQLASLGSQLCFREKDNVRINGRTLLVGDGLDTPAKSLSSCSDVYGTCNSYSNSLSIPNDAQGQSVLATATGAILGEQDYRCFRVAERIEQMEYQFTRQGVFNTDVATSNNEKINAQVILHFFGEVPKKMSVNSDGSYLIAYA